MSSTQTVLSGIRATGKLHLGNYLGALVRFARMSQDPQYNCFFFVADLHTLTTLKEAEQIKSHLPNIVVDYLAAGVDPNQSTIYVQSSVPQVTELSWYLACLTLVTHLEGLPTYKDKSNKQPEDINSGLLFYPVLMAADILGPRAHLVPVGRDQKPHLELTQDLARKFNRLYGDLFPIPDAMSEEMVLIPGLSPMNDQGGFPKMGKSDENTINLSDTSEETWKKIKVAPVDPQRYRRTDPGDPDRCVIFTLHQQVSTPEQLVWSRQGCRTASIGCLECKQVLSNNINDRLSEFRERRQEFLTRPDAVRDVLRDGQKKATTVFDETIEIVRERMGIARYGD
ncbi:MAG: tryptophan--tRNA ligase [bacterium]|nr:tryptophan--tRNA ligase [bacterium]